MIVVDLEKLNKNGIQKFLILGQEEGEKNEFTELDFGTSV